MYYYVKKKESDSYSEISSTFAGIKVLSIKGFTDNGKAINVYNEQWIDSNDEDFAIVGDNGIIRENTDIELTFICSPRYSNSVIDTNTAHDTFVSYMTNGDVYIKSLYENKEVHCVSLGEYKPTDKKLNRGNNSYIIGTITFHKLEKSSNIS